MAQRRLRPRRADRAYGVRNASNGAASCRRAMATTSAPSPSGCRKEERRRPTQIRMQIPSARNTALHRRRAVPPDQTGTSVIWKFPSLSPGSAPQCSRAALAPIVDRLTGKIQVFGQRNSSVTSQSAAFAAASGRGPGRSAWCSTARRATVNNRRLPLQGIGAAGRPDDDDDD